MSDEQKQTHYDLLHRIEKNDRRFRMAQTIFMSLIGFILVGLIAAQFMVIRSFQDQSAERANGLKQLQQDNKQLAQDNKHLTEQTNRYIQCIAQFFATTDRQDRILTDLDDCIYEDGGTTVPGVIVPPTSSNSAATQLQTGQAPSKPDNNSQGQQRAQERPPVRFLGIPVCVPFTNACVRQ